MAIRFTDKMIDNLKPRDRMYDTREADGFGIRVLPSGVKTWFYMYRFDGKRRFLNLGHYPGLSLADARKKHRDALTQVESGIDPLGAVEALRVQRQKTPTVAELLDAFTREHQGKLRTLREFERSIRTEIIPIWGNRKITDVDRADMVLYLREKNKVAPVMANRVLAYTRSLFSWALDAYPVLKENPFKGTWKRVTHQETSRQRSLLDDEIQQFWTKLSACPMSPDMASCLKLILVTAARPGEVAGMHTSEIDESGRWWIIPPERMKNKRPHAVYLTDLALSLIGPLDVDGYIFPAQRKSKTPHLSIASLSRATRRSLSVLGIPEYTPHDLRRTANRLMTQSGIIKEYRERVLSHTLEKLDGTYNVYEYAIEKQKALETVERSLLAIIHNKAGKVVPLRRVKRA